MELRKICHRRALCILIIFILLPQKWDFKTSVISYYQNGLLPFNFWHWSNMENVKSLMGLLNWKFLPLQNDVSKTYTIQCKTTMIVSETALRFSISKPRRRLSKVSAYLFYNNTKRHNILYIIKMILYQHDTIFSKC